MDLLFTSRHLRAKAWFSFIASASVWLLFAMFHHPLSLAAAPVFEGRIAATLMRGGQTQTLFYTVSTNMLRVEREETDRPYARNIVDLDSGAIMLLFPHNGSFVRLNPNSESVMRPPRIPAPSASTPPPAPATIGPTNLPDVPNVSAMPQMPAGFGPQARMGLGGSAMPSMPPMAMPEMEKFELTATSDSTNLLGYACTRYELRQRGEVMEIWATDKLLPFQPWLQNQPPRFGPRMIEEQWGDLLKARKLFPMLATLNFENGPERMRFEVKSVTPKRIEDKDGALFQPPKNYQEVEPLPF